MTRPLAGRRALVTGASRGIGAATARALAAAGASVALAARSRPALEALAGDLGGGLVVPGDLTALADVDATITAVREWAGGAPDIVVCNAGFFPFAPIAETAPAAVRESLALHVEAPFRLVQAFLPDMRTRGSGDIVTVGSTADRQAFPGNAAYSAGKFGARALHEVLRAETRGSGVRAILVSPGAVDTGIWNPVEELLGHGLPARSAMLATDDVARAICFAVSQPPHVAVDELRLTRS